VQETRKNKSHGKNWKDVKSKATVTKLGTDWHPIKTREAHKRFKAALTNP